MWSSNINRNVNSHHFEKVDSILFIFIRMLYFTSFHLRSMWHDNQIHLKVDLGSQYKKLSLAVFKLSDQFPFWAMPTTNSYIWNMSKICLKMRSVHSVFLDIHIQRLEQTPKSMFWCQDWSSHSLHTLRSGSLCVIGCNSSIFPKEILYKYKLLYIFVIVFLW